MKRRLSEVLQTKLPDWIGWLAKIFFALMYLIPLIDIWCIHIERPISKWLGDNSYSISVVKVNGEWLSKESFRQSLASALWRRGELWDSLNDETRTSRRGEALEKLIGDQLITQFASEQKASSPKLRREREEEFQQFIKQFQPPDEWKERMELQGLDERALRSRMSDEVGQLDAIESWLAQQSGKITEANARLWFASHAKELTVSERVRASHIFLTRMADKDQTQDRELEIRELYRKITTGEATFEELASKNSDDEAAKLRGGDLGWFTRLRVPPEFAEKVFALPVGEISAPLESHLGWHILLVKEMQPARAATFDEMKDEITAMLDREWRETAVKKLLKDLRSKAKIEKFDSRISVIEP